MVNGIGENLTNNKTKSASDGHALRVRSAVVPKLASYSAMYKLIVIFAALTPIILLLRAIFAGRTKKGIACVLRIQQTDRSFGLGDLIHDWGHGPLSIGELIHVH